MALSDVVEVVIDIEGASIQTASFNIPMVMAQFASFGAGDTARTKTYASPKELEADGFTAGATDEGKAQVYGMASAIFAQQPAVSQLVVGRRDSGDATVGDALAAVLNSDSSWYGFTVAMPKSVHGSLADEFEEIEAVAEFANANKKAAFAVWAGDPAVITSEITTYEASTLGESERLVIIYADKALEYDANNASGYAQYSAAAFLGMGIVSDPGTINWAYKSLTGINATKLAQGDWSKLSGQTPTAAGSTLRVNTYTKLAGVNITQFGTVANESSKAIYIDILNGVDWLYARIQEAVFLTLVSTKKLSYNDQGIAQVVTIVRSVLEDAVRQGILQANSIQVSAPKYASIGTSDKQNRHLPDVKFTGILNGAINSVKINGTLSV
jgi:hypothetical protein